MILTGTDLRIMVDHCVRGLPDESCGILAGRLDRVVKTYCMRNARPGPASYEMEPEEQFSVMKDIRDSGFEILGLFHSHPAGQAYPSSVDVEHAYWPGTLFPNYPDVVYIIISLVNRAKPDIRGFSIHDNSISEVMLSIIDP